MRRTQAKYGKAFTARLGPRSNVVMLSSPDAVRGVFHGKPEHMNMGDINGLFRRVLGKETRRAAVVSERHDAPTRAERGEQ